MSSTYEKQERIQVIAHDFDESFVVVLRTVHVVLPYGSGVAAEVLGGFVNVVLHIAFFHILRMHDDCGMWTSGHVLPFDALLVDVQRFYGWPVWPLVKK